MTFKHKLSCRLALLKDRGLGALAALLAVATVFSCEQPLPVTDPVVAVERVVISPRAVTLQPDQWADFTAVSLMAGGDTSNIGVVWNATGGVIADTGTVGRRHYGRYKNASCGDYKLIARNSPGWKADTASITVACAAPVASVQVAPGSASVQVGQTVQLAATPRDASGAPLAGRAVTWISSNSSVATVSASGLVTANGAGSATITATSEGVSGTSAITVTALPPPPPVPVASVEVTPASASVQVGQTVQLTATPRDANGNPLTGRVVMWTSTNTSVATVNSSGRVTGVTPGAATITATSEAVSGTSGITVSSVPVASVDVTPASASVPVGGTVPLSATTRDANGQPLSGRVVTWASSNTSVATVTSSGLVTGVAGGSATVSATSEGKSGSAAITVTAPPPPPPPPPPGCQVSSLAWQNTGFTTQNGSFTAQFDATPNGAAIDAVTGLSQGAAAAHTDLAAIVRFNTLGTIDARNGGAYAAVNAIPYTAGTSYRFRLVVDVPTHTYSAYVTPSGGAEVAIGTGYAFRTEQGAAASLANWALYSGIGTHTVCNFSISGTAPPVPVASVDVAPASATVQAGQTVQLTATPKDANGNPLSGRVVTWTSSNTSIATVSASGLVTGQAAGSATITATSEGQSGTSAITVTAPPPPVPVASVEVTPPSASVDEGKTVQLTATPKDANGNPLTGRVVTWTSSNTAVATVSTGGLVTGKVAGTATITATSEGVSGTSAITVVRVPVASVTVTPATASVQEGSTVQLTATPKDASGNPLSGRTVTWASSNTAVATVNASGLVSGVTAGSATITATSEGQSGTSAITVTAPPPPGSGVVLVGAGDISSCSQSNDEATAKLLDGIPGTVFTAGDNAYGDGTDAQFAQCYDPTWGRHKARTRPSPGNHDYHTSGAAGYFNYFGANAGPSGRGYYSYDLGDWHIISLNSNVSMSAGSAQEQWLRADLAASTKRCALAYWHHPRFSSGSHGSSTSSQALWQALYDHNADVVIAGHDHNYQRFAPQTPTGVADPVRGIREFVAGMGGQSHYSFGTPIANTEAYNTNTYGVLKLTLYADRYEWEFVPVAGATYRDSGSGSCH